MKFSNLSTIRAMQHPSQNISLPAVLRISKGKVLLHFIFTREYFLEQEDTSRVDFSTVFLVCSLLRTLCFHVEGTNHSAGSIKKSIFLVLSIKSKFIISQSQELLRYCQGAT